MRPLMALAGNTVTELVRNKLLYVLLVFALLLIVSSVLLAQLTVGQWERIINNVGLATVHLAGALIATLVGVGLIAGEIDRRTAYVVLAKPVSRTGFVVGKYLGLCASLFLIVLVMGGALAAVLGAAGFPMGATGGAALLLTFVELCVLAAFAVVFSSFTTTTLGVIFTLSIFLIGHAVTEMQAFAARSEGVMATLVGIAARALPNLELFNLKTQAANQLEVSGTYVLASLGYGVVYAGLSLTVAALFFSRRDLK